MGVHDTIDPRLAASVLDWWAEAGVDTLVEDAVRDWLAEPAPTAPPAARVVEAPSGTPAYALPEDYAAFAAWRTGGQAPEADWSGVSIAASGPADARVMVLVDCPERDDGRAGQMLGGGAGRLFDRMLAAIGLSREVVHIAAVCARRPSAGRVPRDIEARLGEIARHHVALIAPERLLLLGDAASRAVLGTDRADVRGSLRAFNHRSGQTQAVASYHPRFLMERPAAKAEAWRDLRMLIGGMTA